MFTQNLNLPTFSRTTLARCVYGFAVVSWVYRWFCGGLVYQYQQPILNNPGIDLSYWIAHLLHLPELISSAYFAPTFDILLLLLPVFCFFYTKNTRLSIFYTIILFLYFITTNTYSTVHVHYLVGLLWASVVFWSAEATTFGLLWQGLRYYTCWTYFCAFLWKTGRGFFYLREHAEAVILQENMTYLLQNKNTYDANFLHYLLHHTDMAHYLLNAGMLLQATFIIGFFTKKYDKLLFILPFLFHASTYFLLDVVFWEILVLQFSFFAIKKNI